MPYPLNHWLATVGFGLAFCILASGNRLRAEEVDFVRDIRPLLAQKCFTCHGPDEGTRESGLRLDLADGLFGELESGAQGIVPSDPQQSELYQRLVADEDLRMPPLDSGQRLTSDQIGLIRRWIEQGASYRSHWSFEPLDPTPPAEVEAEDWVENQVDRFVLAKLAREGIAVSPAAPPQTLVRRLYFDLIGLPPTAEQVDAFVADRDPNAYEQWVDRLLASPAFGEHWARRWLDLARYADSDGDLGDKLRPNAFGYRDWVIQAINADMPFDQFTIEQIAGDLLPQATLAQKTATGFHRNGLKNTEAGSDQELDRVVRTVDRISTVGSVWLGLTVGCAECHSHKFDPLSHRQFFQMYAFFDNVEDVDLKTGHGKVTVATIAETKQRRETFVHLRGDFRQPGEKVRPAAPEFLHAFEPRSGKPDRLDFAYWLVDGDNPLTARTTVNRYWMHLFGRGLVDTVDNLGVSGEAPTHPRLLDWLAQELMRQGWSRKRLIKLIVMSATYRQSSQPRADLVDRDPQNRLLARQARFRLDAEGVRDVALRTSGLLDHRIGGPSVRPALSADITAYSRNRDWVVSEGGDRYRRGMYILYRRATPYPMLQIFDAPDTTASCARRDRSNSPLQALTLLNDPVFVECAQHAACYSDWQTDVDWIPQAFRRFLSRDPSAAELARLRVFYDHQRQTLAEFTEAQVRALCGESFAVASADQHDLREQAARYLIYRCLLNLDETITRE
ncbi:Planctomycete cytochrome C [Novipirellula galeiformis]|uniref:Planctomycete cytochrome C n=1 Tax=Novipirellula galeiformis TaxID=2528004 RepID=A0A5C6CLB5_9BACT|nr:PSD1 and planctomycete cytochrome C domain-containing protein [Novipirellula galeiformis]TWU24234.1 Planctomycete cytochrome C [Novipirellula galeiformis]